MSINLSRTGYLQRSATPPWLHLQAAIVAAVLLAWQPLNAQSAPHPATAQPSQAAKTSSRHSAKPVSPQADSPEGRPRPSQVASPEGQPVSAQPETPQWPVNETPGKPAITWDSQGLKINAANSSLRQILNDVSTATGAKVEGFAADERVFGEYGPGQARDVISQLLHGSGYNLLLIGDQGAGTPRQIILSTRKAASSQGQGQQAFNRPIQEMPDEDVPDQPEVEEQPQQQPPLINGRPPGIPPPQGPPGAPRTPQQVLQELQQRQQQMQDQQQQLQDQQQQPH
jgi:hypothetical protein